MRLQSDPHAQKKRRRDVIHNVVFTEVSVIQCGRATDVLRVHLFCLFISMEEQREKRYEHLKETGQGFSNDKPSVSEQRQGLDFSQF